jgi:hypothetical protein
MAMSPALFTTIPHSQIPFFKKYIPHSQIPFFKKYIPHSQIPFFKLPPTYLQYVNIKIFISNF